MFFTFQLEKIDVLYICDTDDSELLKQEQLTGKGVRMLTYAKTSDSSPFAEP